jgi:tetratricopeptide (TPR) repeat protein
MQYALKATEEQNAFSVDAYSLAGQIALANSDVKDAEKYFQEGIKISPTSPELASKLSSLYEHLGTQESINRNPRAAIDYLTKSIDVSPSVGKYYDRAGEYMKVYANSDERAKGYLLASTDYKAARQKARGSVLAQFPWLMPNLIETLIFEGKFPEAKQIAQEFFEELGGDSLVRPSIDPKDLHLIAAFLNATAELLDTGSADKEQYLFENAKLGRQFGRLSWSFAEMLRYLDGDYPKIRPQLDPNEREKRVTAVMQWISQLRGQ